MTKEKEVTLEIRQADSADAALVVDFLNQVGKESDYMTLDEAGIGMSPADIAISDGARDGGKPDLPLAISRSGTGSFVKYHCSFSTVHSAYW